MPGWLPPVRRAVLVPTASVPLPSAPFVADAAALLRAAGAEVDRLDLAGASRAEVEAALAGAQVVFVTGGYAIHLLEHARRSGFDQVASAAVRAGRLAYAGISAGAALAGPDLAPFRDGDDPGTVTSTEGLGLVPFTVLAHRNRGRAARHDRLGGVSIDDDQAVLVEDGAWRIVRSP
ncbi:Type 1 glutamine amidotransferase-like domain-containing protein [Spirillospora sp. CA-253888]